MHYLGHKSGGQSSPKKANLLRTELWRHVIDMRPGGSTVKRDEKVMAGYAFVLW
jgi:hypothetical protein